MICVSIGRSRHRHMAAEHRHLVEQGAKLVELRVDYLRGDISIKRLLTDRPSPVVITCRREADGGKFIGTEEERFMLLRTAIAEGVEYVDLDTEIADQIPRFGKTKRIISFHDFRKTPKNLDKLHERLCQQDPDIVKLATMANHPHDNLRMLSVVRGSKVPTVGICMGDIGVPSRILTGRFGAPFTFATFHHERTLAPGQLSFQEMTEVYRYDDINSETEVYGVIADPVGHSLSPLVHNAAFAELKLNKVYIPIRVPREDLPSFLDEADQLGIRGLSVTIPHKEKVLEKLTRCDEAVRGIGACNTIVLDGTQRLGYNTDHQAAMECLETALGGNPDEHESLLKGKTALVLGAGGAGKAVAYGLVHRGAKVVLSDGVGHVATDLAKRLQCHTVEWPARHKVSADVLVNCTPVGMHPNVDETPYDKHYLRPAMVVFDAVYNPERTLLIKDAMSRNCKVIAGVEMFVRQAVLQLKHFTGQDAPADLMREVIRRSIAAAKY